MFVNDLPTKRLQFPYPYFLGDDSCPTTSPWTTKKEKNCNDFDNDDNFFCQTAK